MSYYVFTSTNNRSIVVEANNQLEARGVIQKEKMSGVDFEFKGELSELIGEEEFVDFSNI